MAAIEFKDWMRKWFRAYHLSMMPEGIRARWEDLRGKDDVEGKDYDVITEDTLEQYRQFTDNQSLKIGQRIYFHDLRTGAQKLWADNKTGKLDTKLPGFDDMSESDQRKFYKMVRRALRYMKDNPPYPADPDNPRPLDRFLGNSDFMAFAASDFNEDAKDKLENFANLVQEDDDLKLKLIGRSSYKNFNDDYPIDAFLEDLRTRNYKKTKTRDKVYEIMGLVKDWTDKTAGMLSFSGEVKESTKDELRKVLGGDAGIIDIINQADDSNDPIVNEQFKQFKQDRVYDEILKSFYDKSKEDRKSGFYKEFAAGGGGEITGYFDDAIGGANYDKMTPKYTDERTWLQKEKKKWDDWNDSHIKKLHDRAYRHIYVEPLAKGPVDAICKEKISPAKGLEAILEKKDAIKKRIAAKSPGSEKGFDFLCSALESMKASDEMKNSLKGALRNGKQTQAIAQEIIKVAVNSTPNKMGDARVALEILAVMRYDTFSSAHASEIWKNKYDPFKDTKLMENKGVAFVLNAGTTAMHLGINGLYWSGVLLRNRIQFARGKMPESAIDKIKGSLEKITKETERFSNAEQAKEELDVAQQRLLDSEIANKKSLDLRNRVEKYLDQKSKLETSLSSVDQDDLEREFSANQKNQKIIKKINSFALKNAQLQMLNMILNDGADGKPGLLKQLDAYKDELNAHDQIMAEQRTAKMIYEHVAKLKRNALEKNVPHKPYNPAGNESQNVATLTWFWNACNGYTKGLNVNDYNFLKKHDKDKHLSAEFNAYAMSMHESMSNVA